MDKLKTLVNNFSKLRPTIKLAILGLIILSLVVGIPTLARYKNRIITTTIVWDGTIASNYNDGDGTANNPYLITNGAELAYFSNQLITEDYDNAYFKLADDILLNDGSFNYHNQQIEYILNGTTYYIKPNTNDYYDNSNYEGTPIGQVNEFIPLDHFKGEFDGDSYRINGLYMNDQTSEQLALFTNLNGNVKNLYLENSLIVGGNTTALLASETSDAIINNIIVDGTVIGKDTLNNQTKTAVITDQSYSINQSLNNNTLSLLNNIPTHRGVIISTSLTGEYTLSGVNESNATIKINNQIISGGIFEIDLGSSLLNDVSLSTIASSGVGNVNFSNIKYNITYQYGVTAGVVAKSYQSTFNNIVNKADVYGKNIASGIIGVTTTNLSLNNSYNLGNINAADITGGLIGVIEKSTNPIMVSNSYNEATLNSAETGSLIGIIKDNSGAVNITNVFHTAPANYSIYQILNTPVNIERGYHISSTNAIYSGTANGYFTTTTLNNLFDKNYVLNNMLLNEFISIEDLELNPNNVWIYEVDSLPKLYIDDLNKPIASINAGIYAWNNFSTILKAINFTKSTAFSIEELDATNPIQNAFYYLSNEIIPANQLTNLDWLTYNEIVNLNQEGTFIIYAKVIDYSNNITYLNSDKLVLNFPGLKMDNYKWTTLNSNLNNIYLDQSKEISVTGAEQFTTKEYYITNQILDELDLDSLTSEWISYIDKININTMGKHIVYLKLVDNENNVKYINSDYLIYDGYHLTDAYPGRNSTSFSAYALNMTDKSNITFKFNYNAVTNAPTNFTHNLMSSILLPLNTKITITDKILNKTYVYQVDTNNDNFGYHDSCLVADINCQKFATYPLTLFTEVGNISKKYIEDNYYQDGVINESWLINFDFSKTNLTNNQQDIITKMALLDVDNKIIRPTLYNDLQSFNLNYNQKATLDLSTNDSIILNFNNNDIQKIILNSKLNHPVINDQKIVDTTHEDKQMGLAISFENNENQVLDKSYLRNFIFKIGDNTYTPSNDNIVRINLATGSTSNPELTIMTFNNNSDLPTGDYILKIRNYLTIDGNYYHINDIGNDTITIPVIVNNNQIKDNYSFDVLMDDNSRIISQKDISTKVDFNILTAGSFDNPIVKVSLYQKEQATAYNQNYTLIDLQTYTSDLLNSSGNQTYIVTNNPLIYDPVNRLYNQFSLNLFSNQLAKNSYKLVFDLYDKLKHLGSIEKYFIVK